MSDTSQNLPGYKLIENERLRQQGELGYSQEDDLTYVDNELVFAAIAYLTPEEFREFPASTDVRVKFNKSVPNIFPWSEQHWKPSPDDREKELIKAGALIAAELDRYRTEKHLHELSLIDSVKTTSKK